MAVLHEVSIPPHNAGPFFLATCYYPSQNSGACIAIQLSCWVFALAANREAACSVFPPHSVTFSCARPPACAMAAVPKSRSMAVLRLMSDLKALNSEPPAVRGKAGKPVCLLRRQHMAPLTSTHTRSSRTALVAGLPQGCSASPVSDDNVFEWDATVIGPEESPWEGRLSGAVLWGLGCTSHFLRVQAACSR